EAIEAYQQFIDRYPSHFAVASAMRSKAQALEQIQEYNKAGQAYENVHASYPEGEYAVQDLLSAGRNYHLGQNLEASERAYSFLIRQYPQSPLVHEAVYNLGRVLLDDQRTEEALIQFKAIVDFSGTTERKPDALLDIGKIALSREDLEEANRIFDDLRKKFPKSLSAENAYLVLGGWYANTENWAGAEAVYRQATTHLSRNARRQQALLGRANALRKLNRSDEALKLYTEFLKAYPKSPFFAHARLGHGRAFADLKNYRDALQALKRLQESFPNTDVSIQAYGDIGNIWRTLGTPQKALSAYQAYESKIQSPQEKASARLQIAHIYEDLNWHDLASDSYRQLIAGDIVRYAAEGQFGLAQIFKKTGKTKLALREYRTYLKNHADGPHAETAEARIQLLKEFYTPTPQEITWIDLLTNLHAITTDPLSTFQMGKALYERKMYHQAAEHLETIRSQDEANKWSAEALYLLGNSHLKLAKKSKLENTIQETNKHSEVGLNHLKSLVDTFPNSDWTDDAVLSITAAETASLPDSTRASQQKERYSAFLANYPQSNRIHEAKLRIADTDLTTNDIANAYKTYQAVQTQTDNQQNKERATYGIGLCQTRLGNPAEAENTLRDFLFQYPQSDLAPHARFQLGQILLRDLKYYASAAEEFSELLAAPSSLELERASRSLLAECYFQLKDYNQAITIDETLLRRETSPDLLRRLAKSYFNNNQHDKAVTTYAHFLRKFPNASDADSIAFTRAERLAFLDRTPEAINAFREFASKYKSSPLKVQADQAIGDLFFQTERYADAINAYGQIPQTSRNETIAGREVLSLYRLKRVKQADKAANQFKKTYKTATEWLAQFEVEKGKYQLAIKNPKKARQKFEDVIKKFPQTAARSDASYYIIRAYYDEGPDKEGNNEPYFESLLQFVRNFSDNPYWVEANLELAKYWEANEEYASSATYYRNALDKGLEQSKKAEILYRLSKNFNYLKSWSVGIDYARQLVKEFPQHKRAIEARLDIAQMLQFKGDYEASIREFLPLLKLVTTEDDRASIRYSIGENYFNMGDYNNARREFFSLTFNTKISTNWIASSLTQVAECYTAQGDIDQAIAALEQVKVRFGATSSFGVSAENRIQKLRNRGGSNFLPR
ncbi:MAG: tetratricopeptide repeat protein, partial [Candidatus Latescibacteria bacterium]|nr:tetratricopeptide repeat protein [Candidatus Latescibacterota bacterium]